MCASPTWKTADLIDFELLLASPAGETDGPEFFTEHLASQLSPEAQVDRPQVFKAWLNAHRSSAKEVGLGLRCVASWKAIASLGSLFGLLLGGSLTATLLHYQGTEPINVTWFLFSTLGLQFLLLFIFALLSLIRSTTGFFEDFHPLRSTLGSLSNRFINKLPAADRHRLRVALAQFAQKGSVYQSIIPWPPLIVTQIFALGFNLGILATLLAHIAATDLAFGWQSTIQLSPAFVSHLVSLLASPWSWILPNPHPSPPEIIATHFSYIDGMPAALGTAGTSWWPFLAYSIAFYGLFFRAFLLFFLHRKLQSHLRALPFTHGRCLSLFRHLTGPLIASTPTEPLVIPPLPPQTEPRPSSSGSAILLLSKDFSACSASPTDYLQSRFGWSTAQTLITPIDHPGANATILATLTALHQSTTPPKAVVVLIRSHRSPIKAIALFLKEVATHLPPSTELIILLAGQGSENPLQPVSDQEWSNWKNFQAIHHLSLSLEKWNP